MSKTTHNRWLKKRICDLDLKIPGSPLGKLVSQLYSELEGAGIAFKPGTYLSDEWGCPHGSPLIGIPFYLADKTLCQLEHEFSGVPAETDEEVMMYLRHEAGHALNYAYRLYEGAEWKRLFGRFSRPYSDAYKTEPFSSRYVRHIPGWYAQKHPDEDFAETFAVWLTPESNWQQAYRGYAASKKLAYVEKTLHSLGSKAPPRVEPTPDLPVRELTCTLGDWYRAGKRSSARRFKLPGLIDLDLRKLFPACRGRPAAKTLAENKGEIVLQVNDWTGLEKHSLGLLFEGLLERSDSLGLKIPSTDEHRHLINFTAFLTSLAMVYQTNGRFV